MPLDLCLYPAGLDDAELVAMKAFGLDGGLGLIDPATATPESLSARFEGLVEHERPRLERRGLALTLALGVPPTALPRRGFESVVEGLSRHLRKGVVGAIATGLSRGDALEELVFAAHVELAERFALPLLVSLSKGDPGRFTRRAMALLTDLGVEPDRALLLGVSPAMVRTVLGLGFHAGLVPGPGASAVTHAKVVELVSTLGPERLHLGSGAGTGEFDALAVPRVMHRLRQAGVSRAVAERVGGKNTLGWLGRRG